MIMNDLTTTSPVVTKEQGDVFIMLSHLLVETRLLYSQAKKR